MTSRPSPDDLVEIHLISLTDVVGHTTFDVAITDAAFYTDRYRKVDGERWISHTGYKRTYEEIFPRKSIDGLQITAQWWATDGRSSLIS